MYLFCYRCRALGHGSFFKSALTEGARARKAEADSRKAEANERRIDRSLDLIRIASNSDPKTGKDTSGMLQIAAITLLADFPEYYDAYRSMDDFWQSLPVEQTNPHVTRAMHLLCKKTKPEGI